MAIFIYCDKCEKVVGLNECAHEKELVRNDTKNYINMRTTWSGQTQVEFSQMTMDEDIKQRNGEI
jgi:hypothetical protein